MSDDYHDMLSKHSHTLQRMRSTKAAEHLTKKAKARLGKPESTARTPEASRAEWKYETEVAESRAKAVHSALTDRMPGYPGPQRAHDILVQERRTGSPMRDTVPLAKIKRTHHLTTEAGRETRKSGSRLPVGRGLDRGRFEAHRARSNYIMTGQLSETQQKYAAATALKDSNFKAPSFTPTYEQNLSSTLNPPKDLGPKPGNEPQGRAAQAERGLRARAVASSVKAGRSQTTDKAKRAARTEQAFNELTSPVNQSKMPKPPKGLLTEGPSETMSRMKPSGGPRPDVGRVRARIVRSAGQEGSWVTKGMAKDVLKGAAKQEAAQVAQSINATRVRTAGRVGGTALSVAGALLSAPQTIKDLRNLKAGTHYTTKTGEVKLKPGYRDM